MNVGSLFSGIGGIELGFEAEGFNTVWCVEYDTYAQFILKKHFPKAIIYGDIKEVDFGAVPKVDILTGGFPCQDISNAGKRVGITGSRSSLWKYYLKAIREIRPRYALIENVSALTHRGLDVVLADLAEIGYDAEWYNISASAVGAHHTRERLFIIAYSNSIRCMDTRIKINTKKTQQQTQRNDGIPLSWATRSRVRRSDDGIPFASYRIKCLGNAVVPQVAQVFARAIKEVEEGDSS